MTNDLQQRLAATAFAFRGYNVTNLGRSAELLAQRAYQATVERHLAEASEVCSEVTGQAVDLAARVRRGEETSLATYPEAVSLVIAMEMAQLHLLSECFDVCYARAKLAYGYSLGEMAAVIAGGVFEMRDALRIPLTMAADCVALAEGVTMGVLFSRGALLGLDDILRLCVRITAEGHGVIGVSSQLSPNTVLLLGQGGTIDRFMELMAGSLPERVYLRKNHDAWPPLHTPLVWQRNIPNRAGVLMQTMPGGLKKPDVPIFSLVTGKRSYNDFNARDLLTRWIDHPQRLWDAVYETLASGIEVVVHVGPDPNLIPATFHRLTDNVTAQLEGKSLGSFGRRAMSQALRRPWLSGLLPSRSALLRAPHVAHVILEDWLLEHAPQ